MVSLQDDSKLVATYIAYRPMLEGDFEHC